METIIAEALAEQRLALMIRNKFEKERVTLILDSLDELLPAFSGD